MSSDALKVFIRRASTEAVAALVPGCRTGSQDLTAALPVLGPWMSLALVAAPELRVTIKSHFSKEQLRPLMRSLGLSADIKDFMNEYSNLFAGLLKRSLMEDGLGAGMSLPLSLRGFDEVFFPVEDKKTVFTDRWAVIGSFDNVQFEFKCSTMIEIYDPSVTRRMNFKLNTAPAAVEWI